MYTAYMCVPGIYVYISHTCIRTENFQGCNINNEMGIWRNISIDFIPPKQNKNK